jgi:hypothetical protein
VIRPYEDPRKASMRSKCEIAIDAAGYSLREVSPIPFAAGSLLKGSLLGDLQATDADNVVHVYYLRPEVNRPLPQWLSNLAVEARKLSGVKMYVIVEALSTVLEKTCRGCGAGLLRLDENGRFEIVVDAGEIEDAAAKEAVRLRVTGLRRKLETKLELNINEIKSSFSTVVRVTAGMAEKKRDEYLRDVEKQLERWRAWGDDLSAQLDEVAALGIAERLDEIGRLIDKSPTNNGD